MTLAVNIGLLFATFAFMEFVAWFTHKYVMHGFLWKLHRDHHHRNADSPFERNDFFFLMFALPAIVLFYLGYDDGQLNTLFFIGAGVTLYGMSYVFVHDIFVHQRIRIFTRTENTYLRAMRMAHKIHHKHLTKEDGECFGFLWVKRPYLDSARNSGRRG
jgi:beta-carotene 3-hydroxylase